MNCDLRLSDTVCLVFQHCNALISHRWCSNTRSRPLIELLSLCVCWALQQDCQAVPRKRESGFSRGWSRRRVGSVDFCFLFSLSTNSCQDRVSLLTFVEEAFVILFRRGGLCYSLSSRRLLLSSIHQASLFFVLYTIPLSSSTCFSSNNQYPSFYKAHPCYSLEPVPSNTATATEPQIKIPSSIHNQTKCATPPPPLSPLSSVAAQDPSVAIATVSSDRAVTDNTTGALAAMLTSELAPAAMDPARAGLYTDKWCKETSWRVIGNYVFRRSGF